MTKPKSSWRDVLPIHPAAELFPLMSRDELKVLGEDIRQNGLHVPVSVWKEQKNFPPRLIDGRNRLDAMEAVGLAIRVENAGTEFAPEIKLWVRSTPDDMWWSINVIEMREDKCGISPYDYVISVNIHRRHLSVAEKRELVAKLLKAAPAKSNRAIAEAVKVDHKTVAAVRTEKVATGEIPQLTKTVGKDGKTRKARTKPDAWEYKTGTATACYTAGDGAQIYKVEEIARKRKTPRYHAWVLTEVGHVTFDKVFHSMEAAKRFCEHHAREWQRNNEGAGKPPTTKPPPKNSITAQAPLSAPSAIALFDLCVMEVRALIRRMLPDIPRDQWLRLIGELRDEIDDIQRKVLAESEVKRNGAAQRGAP